MIDLLGTQRAVFRSARPTTEKIVVLAILDFYSESSPEPWPSVPTLVERCSLGRTAVLEAIASLERDTVLVVRRVQGRPNRYDLSRVESVLTRMTATKEPAATEPDSENGMVPVRLADGSSHEDEITVERQDAPAETLPTTSTSPPGGRDESNSRTGPVRHTDWLPPPTSPPGGRDQSAWRTGPVRLADPKEPMKESKKEATAVRAHATPLDPTMPLVERARLVLRDARAAPGQHSLVAQSGDRKSLTRALTVAPGSDEDVHLEVPPAEPAPIPAASVPPLPTAPVVRTAPAPKVETHTARDAVVVAGATLTVGGVVLGVFSLMQRDAARASRTSTIRQLRAEVPSSYGDNMLCQPRQDIPAKCAELSKQVDDEVAAGNLATGSFIAAGVLGAATVATYLLWPTSSAREGRASLAVQPLEVGGA